MREPECFDSSIADPHLSEDAHELPLAMLAGRGWRPAGRLTWCSVPLYRRSWCDPARPTRHLPARSVLMPVGTTRSSHAEASRNAMAQVSRAKLSALRGVAPAFVVSGTESPVSGLSWGGKRRRLRHFRPCAGPADDPYLVFGLRTFAGGRRRQKVPGKPFRRLRVIADPHGPPRRFPPSKEAQSRIRDRRKSQVSGLVDGRTL